MNQHRIKMSDIVIGQPLPWDVFDAGNHLLLRKGHIVESEQQVEVLMERGMFVDASQVQQKETPQSAPKERPSVLRLVNLANQRLERLLFNLHSETDAAGKILEVARAITYAVDLDSDTALACILLNQTTGSYPVRHCVDTALVSLLIGRALKRPADETLAMAAAALTMNLAMLKLQERLHSVQGPLSDADMQIIRNHPQQSVNILRNMGIDNSDWLSIVLMHHENEDGSGYPGGKKSEEIPVSAKIISLAPSKTQTLMPMPLSLLQ